jgi:uncharacterized protein YndB with AHSA1/START domain
MTVLDTVTDPTARTVTITAHFDAPVDRVWTLWSDPRKLERWWGPPEYPATVTVHDLTVGGEGVRYHMTGPEGDRHGGYWRILDVDAPHHLAFEDGFLTPDGTANTELPSIRGDVTIASDPAGGTSMTVVTSFSSVEAMEQLVAMGMVEGMQAAMGQIDAILAGDGATDRETGASAPQR